MDFFYGCRRVPQLIILTFDDSGRQRQIKIKEKAQKQRTFPLINLFIFARFLI
jgi:hypothetical protein